MALNCTFTNEGKTVGVRVGSDDPVVAESVCRISFPSLTDFKYETEVPPTEAVVSYLQDAKPLADAAKKRVSAPSIETP